MIELSAQFTDLLEREHYFAHFLRIEFDDVTLYLTDAPHDITHGGVVYQSGFWHKAPAFDVNGEVRVGQTTFNLTDVTTEITALLFQNKWLNRQVVVERAYFELDWSPVATIELWRGLLNENGGDISPTSAKQNLKAASQWADYSASRGRRTNSKSQQIFFPTDKGFDFCGQVQNDIDWGQKSKSSGTASGGGSGGTDGGTTTPVNAF